MLSDKADIKSVLVDGKPSKYSFGSGKLTLPALPASQGPLRISISYDAVFNDPVVSEPASFDNPGFGVTGSIGERGTFLLEDSGWYPRFAGCNPVGPAAEPPGQPNEIAMGGTRERFNIEVTAPRGIYAVTAGERVGQEDRNAVSISRWKTDPIGQGLSLSAGRYIVRQAPSPLPSLPHPSLSLREWEKRNGVVEGRGGENRNVPVYTYFTSENDSLSETYLNAAASHIAFYERLHGPYPFPKFAVVENFFPTGYGFPSYTLLGGSVLRLPFIPQTSLRHEIAHSWWGNGVLVDYASGNWCEGLTTYVADYLSQEISSPPDGRLYRKQILQDYATLAASGADLPLRAFGSRSSPATRAVGYGKAAFVFHMIRQKLGDEAFWKCLRQIYKERLFVRTSWDDFRDAFVRTGGWDAGEARVFFNQWIARSGAPVLKLENVQSRKMGAAGWQTTGSLLQDPPWYDLDVTAAVKTSQTERVDTKIRISEGSASFSIQSAAAPEKLIVDPDVNTFRLLCPEEIPATVNSIKGSHGLLAVFTEDGGRKTEDGKQRTEDGGWRAEHGGRRAAFELLLDGLDQADARIIGEKEAEMKLSDNKDLLFLGLPRSKKLKSFLESAPEEVKRHMAVNDGRKSEEGRGADCLFLVFKDPNRGGGITALFLPVPGTSPDSILTAARKITHYGKYSYLSFSQGVIQDKGVWEISHSPMEIDFKSSSSRPEGTP
jgi:hypothetical protein